MGSPSLDASPTLALLLDLAGRRVSGRLELGSHTFLISDGLLVDVLPAASEQDASPESGLGGQRELLIDRVARALRTAEERGEPLPVLEPAPGQKHGDGFPLVPLLLDAMVTAATDEHAALLATHMNHRLTLKEGVLADHVRAWARIESVPPRPALSTVLAERPEAGPAVTALLLTGAARLEAPGRAGPSLPSRASTLPPPPPRLSSLPAEPPTGIAMLSRLSQLSVRAPRLRLDPGQANDAGELLTPTALPLLRGEAIALEDPIEPLEQKIAALEKAGAPGPERARAFTALADVWLQRFGSIERACRALREAVAADPTDGRALTQTALYCHVLGQSELAQRYCEAAIAASAISVERASAQRLRASVLRAAGDREGAVEALCEAAADDPGSPEPHEHLLSLLEPENPEGANAHARLAAAAFQDREPQRALALLDQAAQLAPRDVATAQELASMLDAAGLRLAAVHALERAAAQQSDADTRRKLQLSAAQRAEAAGRADIAAELLEAAFDAEPEFDLVHAPLDEDLSATGFVETRAVLLEDIATACPDAQRSHWLTRAAEVRGGLEGERDAAVWLSFEAVLIDPRQPEALILLRQLAKEPVELTLLAYALRAAAVAHMHAGSDARPLLRELALLAIERLDNAQLGIATLDELARRAPLEPEMAALRSIAERRAKEREAELARAEAALSAAAPSQRAERCLRVASLLPDLPETWPRRIALLEAALAGGVRAPSVPITLESLYGLSRDAGALAAFLEARARKSAAPAERIRALSRLTSVHAVRDDDEAIALTCEHLLEIAPSHRMALARLERVAKRTRNLPRLERALRGRLEITQAKKPRARLLARLAHVYAKLGRPRDVVTCAAGSLELDAHAADAAMLVLEHAEHLPAEGSVALLEALPSVLGPSARLFAALVHAARGRSDQACVDRTLARWVALLPSDATAHGLRLALLSPSAPPSVLGEAAERALSACPVERVAKAVLETIDALANKGNSTALTPERARLAASLCLRLAEERGHADRGLTRRAAELAKTHAPELATRALELLASTAEESDKVDALLTLGKHHAALGDSAAELRALLRVLELDITHHAALSRVRFLYRASGDMVRAQAVTSLLLELETDAQGRRERLLELSALAAREQDLDRVEQHVRHMIGQSEGDPALVRGALGVLLEVGPIEWALARSRAIADDCPPDVRGPIYHSIAATSEQILADPRLALELAAMGARTTPNYSPLLLMVERLALAGSDPSIAVETYESLLAHAIGPHGRRALLYRAGRWLERAGRPAEAFERYLAAFELEPTAGAAFTALDRVARDSGQLERTLPCYERLSDTVHHEGARIELLRRAVMLALDELDAPERAFELARQALALRENAELLGLAERSARVLRTRDEHAGKAAFDQLVLDLTQRAEQLWDGPDKVRSLINIGRMLHEQLGRTDAARGCLSDALALTQREQLGDSLLAEVRAAQETLPMLPQPARTEAARTPSPAPPPPVEPPRQPPLQLAEPPEHEHEHEHEHEYEHEYEHEHEPSLHRELHPSLPNQRPP